MQGQRRPEIPPPSVELAPAETTAFSVSFDLTPSHAQTAAYIFVTADAAIPAAGEILASGIPADPSEKKRYTIDGLDPATEYLIVAAASDGAIRSDVQTLKISTSKQPAPQWDVETECINIIAEYYGNEKLGGDNGQFWINLTDMEVDEQGRALTDGIQYALSIHSDLVADPENPAPATGTYTFDTMDTFDQFTIDNSYSKWIRLKDALTDPSQEEGRFAEGSLVLNKEGDSYELTALLTTDEGLIHKATYSGPIRWRNMTTPPVIDRHLDAVFGRAIYYGVGEKNPETDNWVIGLYDKAEQPSVMLVLDFYSAVSAKPTDPTIPDGAYSPNDGSAVTAGTFTPGYNVDGLYDMGTYYTFTAANGKTYTYYLSEGSFTISRDGSEYTVTADLAVDDGTKVTGTFCGTFSLTNNYDPAVGADLNVAYDRVYNEPGNFRAGAVNEYYFCLADTEMTGQPAPVDGGEGNWIAVDLWSATAPPDMSDIAIPEGTYTWNPDNSDGTFDPFFSFGWHWDADGVAYLINPVSGTVTVNHSGNNYSILVQWVTDKDEKLVGTYCGPITLADRTANAPDAGEVSRRMLYSRNAAVGRQADAAAFRAGIGQLPPPASSDGTVFRSAGL